MSGKPFAEKSVLVTGGARGQGRAHAIAFAERGASVGVCDIAAQIQSVPYDLAGAADLERTGELIEAVGGEVVLGTVDVRDFAELAAFAARIEARFGGPDIVIANAGIVSFAAAEEMSDEMFSDVLDIDLKGVWNAFKAGIPGMRGRKFGRLLATGSAASLKAIPNALHYTAAKHGIVGLVKTVALEVAADGITANMVSPGNVGTDMVFNEALYELFDPANPTRASLEAALEEKNALPGGWMDSTEISKALLYLASDDASRVTGTNLFVDMGMTIK
jgi:SDR family mycofactocin-dependent oxidoreductase